MGPLRHDDYEPRSGIDFGPGAEGAFDELTHYLHTPLSVVLANVEMLVEGDAGELSPQQAAMLRAAHRNARRLRGRIDELLAGS